MVSRRPITVLEVMRREEQNEGQSVGQTVEQKSATETKSYEPSRAAKKEQGEAQGEARTEGKRRKKKDADRWEYREDFLEAWAVYLDSLPPVERELAKPSPNRELLYRQRLTDSRQDEILDALRGWPLDSWAERKNPAAHTWEVILGNRARVEKFACMVRRDRVADREYTQNLLALIDPSEILELGEGAL